VPNVNEGLSVDGVPVIGPDDVNSDAGFNRALAGKSAEPKATPADARPAPVAPDMDSPLDIARHLLSDDRVSNDVQAGLTNDSDPKPVDEAARTAALMRAPRATEGTRVLDAQEQVAQANLMRTIERGLQGEKEDKFAQLDNLMYAHALDEYGNELPRNAGIVFRMAQAELSDTDYFEYQVHLGLLDDANEELREAGFEIGDESDSLGFSPAMIKAAEAYADEFAREQIEGQGIIRREREAVEYTLANSKHVDDTIKEVADMYGVTKAGLDHVSAAMQEQTGMSLQQAAFLTPVEGRHERIADLVLPYIARLRAERTAEVQDHVAAGVTKLDGMRLYEQVNDGVEAGLTVGGKRKVETLPIDPASREMRIRLLAEKEEKAMRAAPHPSRGDETAADIKADIVAWAKAGGNQSGNSTDVESGYTVNGKPTRDPVGVGKEIAAEKDKRHLETYGFRRR
jgi:hypothetical protein